jgi:hypothetical protein
MRNFAASPKIPSDRYTVRDMDWVVSPLATLLGGGIIGAGSALLLDSVKTRRALKQQWQDARTEVYVAYLTELSKAYESLWALALGDYENPSPDKKATARRIFRTGELFQTRQRLKITASSRVIVACDEAYVNLRQFRAVVSEGAESDSSEFLASNQVYRASVQVLQHEIRRELRIPDPSPRVD